MRHDGDTYTPELAEIISVLDETPDTKTFTLKMRNGQKLEYKPGQFLELSIFGKGEAPISITSPSTRDNFELCIRSVGKVTTAMHTLKSGDTVGIRGPYGNFFPVEKFYGKDVLFVAGGIGLAPLRSLILYMIDIKDRFGKITILYGARTPADRIFKNELDEWNSIEDVSVKNCVDCDDKSCSFEGEVCLVTEILARETVNPKNTVAFVCGPLIMINSVNQELLKHGLSGDDIIMTLERMMKCGVGKCGHCNIGDKYICIDGPVFSYSKVKDIPKDE